MTPGAMRQSLGARTGLDKAGMLHGLRLAAAASLAFAVATAFHIENAYWAAMPVWVVSQPTRGLLLERAAFRLFGTLIGASVGFGLVGLQLDATVVLALLSCWIAGNAFLAQALRGVQGYGFVLAGMTAAVVVLPSVLDPSHAAALATARVVCTLIGIVSVTVVTGLWTPSAPREAFYARVRRIAEQARSIASSPHGSHDGSEIRHALREMAELQVEAGLISAGSPSGYRRLRHVDGLIVAGLGVLAETQARDWSRQPGNVAPGVGEAEAKTGYDQRLGAALDRLRKAESAFAGEGGDADAKSFAPKMVYLAPNRDWGIATEAAAIAGIGTFVVACLAVASGWAASELTALGVCIFSMVLGTLPSPKAVAPVMIKGVCVGVATALVYRLVIQPHVLTVPALIASVVPFLLLGGVARASRKTAAPALDANMCFLLGSQATLPPVTDTSAILAGSAALLVAVAIVAPVFMMLPSGPERRAANAARDIRKDLLRMIRLSQSVDPEQLRARTTRQILRLSLHLERHVRFSRQPDAHALPALVLGNAIASLLTLRDAPQTEVTARQLALRGLQMLEQMDERPAMTADDLDRLATAVPAGSAAIAVLLREVAAALRKAAPLVFGHRGPVAA